MEGHGWHSQMAAQWNRTCVYNYTLFWEGGECGWRGRGNQGSLRCWPALTPKDRTWLTFFPGCDLRTPSRNTHQNWLLDTHSASHPSIIPLRLLTRRTYSLSFSLEGLSLAEAHWGCPGGECLSRVTRRSRKRKIFNLMLHLTHSSPQ